MTTMLKDVNSRLKKSINYKNNLNVMEITKDKLISPVDPC